jgi:hypothetical protein
LKGKGNMDRIKYTLRSFAANRKIAEENLVKIRDVINDLRWLRQKRRFRYFLLYPLYVIEKRKIISEFRETRRRIFIYRKVENGLWEGNLTLAIEALSEFCSRPETTSEAINRIKRNVPTIENVLRSLNILRMNMLAVRKELIALQKQQSA